MTELNFTTNILVSTEERGDTLTFFGERESTKETWLPGLEAARFLLPFFNRDGSGIPYEPTIEAKKAKNGFGVKPCISLEFWQLIRKPFVRGLYEAQSQKAPVGKKLFIVTDRGERLHIGTVETFRERIGLDGLCFSVVSGETKNYGVDQAISWVVENADSQIEFVWEA